MTAALVARWPVSEAPDQQPAVDDARRGQRRAVLGAVVAIGFAVGFLAGLFASHDGRHCRPNFAKARKALAAVAEIRIGRTAR